MEKGIRTIAFPSISTGAFAYPVKDAARVAVSAVKQFVDEHPDAFDDIYWVLFDNQTKSVYERVLEEIR